MLYLTGDSWLYLYDSKVSSSYSGWISTQYPQNSVERLLEYWKINPRKIPGIIYIDRYFPDSSNAGRELNVNNYSLTETNRGYILK